MNAHTHNIAPSAMAALRALDDAVNDALSAVEQAAPGSEALRMIQAMRYPAGKLCDDGRALMMQPCIHKGATL